MKVVSLILLLNLFWFWPSQAHSISLINYRNKLFYGTIKVGTPGVSFPVVFDTGSTLFLLFDESCSVSFCRTVSQKYSLSKSLTGQNGNNNRPFSSAYNSLRCTGKNLQDNILVSNFGSIFFNFGSVDYIDTGLQDFPASGIMGMYFGGIISKLYESKQINKAFFVFELSNIQPRLWIGAFPPNLSEADFKSVDLIPGKMKYVISLDEFGTYENNQKKLSFPLEDKKEMETLVDTGSTFIKLPQKFWSKLGISNGNIRCNDLQKKPKLYFRLGTHTFTLEPKDYYISYQDDSSYCEPALRPQIEGFTLGIPFLMKYPSLFDLESKKIGFLSSSNL